METAVWLMSVVAAFVAGMFLGVSLVRAAVRVIDTRELLADDDGEGDDSEAWKRC